MIQVLQSLGGIGDGVLGLTAVCGIKARFPSETVVYACRPNVYPWVALFEGYDALADREWPTAVTYDLARSWPLEVESRGGGRTRAEWYASYCGNVKPRNPIPRALPRSNCPGYVVLCPLTAQWPRREWLLPNWMALERMLLEHGLPVMVLTHDPQKVRHLKSPAFAGTPIEVASIIKEAGVVVGVDTGLLHLCGALGAPGIVLAGPTLGRLVFGNWPTIRVIEGNALACHGCYGVGIPDSCENTCAALNHTRPQAVFDMILDTLQGRKTPDDGLARGQRRDPITAEVQPWFTGPALSEIQEWDLADKVVLEWGGGFSSLWWAMRCRSVFTIEADKKWCEWIAAEALARGVTNIALLHRPLEQSTEEYAEVPPGCRPDVVVVDGARRLSCLRRALTLPRPVTIVFDNWQQRGGFICPEAQALMKSFAGVSYADMELGDDKRPWQTAVWHLS